MFDQGSRNGFQVIAQSSYNIDSLEFNDTDRILYISTEAPFATVIYGRTNDGFGSQFTIALPFTGLTGGMWFDNVRRTLWLAEKLGSNPARLHELDIDTNIWTSHNLPGSIGDITAITGDEINGNVYISDGNLSDDIYVRPFNVNTYTSLSYNQGGAPISIEYNEFDGLIYVCETFANSGQTRKIVNNGGAGGAWQDVGGWTTATGFPVKLSHDKQDGTVWVTTISNGLFLKSQSASNWSLYSTVFGFILDQNAYNNDTKTLALSNSNDDFVFSTYSHNSSGKIALYTREDASSPFVKVDAVQTYHNLGFPQEVTVTGLVPASWQYFLSFDSGVWSLDEFYELRNPSYTPDAVNDN